MPLQNRVDPFGDIHAVDARGMFTGNRGVIHDPETKTLLGRRWTTKAWIICTCDYKGVRREVMGRNGPNGGPGWTELFFLDEVTALAAGHRPCFLCRREKAKEFAACFGRAFEIAEPKAPDMDERLHQERHASAKSRPSTDPSMTDTLPDGTVVSNGRTAYALRDGKLLHWSFAGYSRGAPEIDRQRLQVVTPPATVEVLRAGYRPVWHPTAERT